MFTPGDRIGHIHFGRGTVVKVEPLEERLYVAFDRDRLRDRLRTLSTSDRFRHLIVERNGERLDRYPAYVEDLRYLTHLKNLPSILENGILSRNQVLARKIHFQDVSERGVQELRARIAIRSGSQERPLHDYVNLFFARRPPMLFSVRHSYAQDRLVYVCVSSGVLALPGVLVSDGNVAVQGLRKSDTTRVILVPAQSSHDVCQRLYVPPSYRPTKYQNRALTLLATVEPGLSRLDFGVIHSDEPPKDDEEKRRRQAEVLVPDSIPPHYFTTIVTPNEDVAHHVGQILARCQLPLPPRIHVAPSWFVTAHDMHTFKSDIARAKRKRSSLRDRISRFFTQPALPFLHEAVEIPLLPLDDDEGTPPW